MDTTTAAPAPDTTETPTQTASLAAVVANDFPALREAEQARRLGKPLPDVPVKASETKPPADASAGTEAAPAQTETPRQLSKRQQEQNERVRAAVALAMQERDAEIARLKAQAQPPKTEPRPASVQPVNATDPEPDPTNVEKYPEGQFDRQYLKDQAHWEAQQVLEKFQRQTEKARAESEAIAAVTQTITGFQEQITTAGGKTFLDTLTPEVQALRPVEALEAAGELAKVGPLNVLTSAIVKSATAPQLLQYFSEHPDELQRFQTLASTADVYLELGKVVTRLEAPSRPGPKTLTSAPAPARVLSARPSAPADPERAAVEQNNFSAFQAARRAARLASRV